ncbi:MAG: UDP-N-acetylglucosamine--N-acetylmuramyl-(pentapeptide) pyrophosphoryl-undecaprenol N-acetylglucosamine transferase [Gaiellaceae bacterium]
MPALAVAEALRARGASVTLASDREFRPAEEAGLEVDVFGVEGFHRALGPRLARALLRAPVAVADCVRILRRRRPQVVLGAGGYVGGPMVLAAGILRIPAALTEADAHFGLANRLAAPFAQRIFLAFPVEGLQGDKYRLVGRPIPRRSEAVDQAEARRRFGLPEAGQVVLVFGGSQGARRLNEAALEAFAVDGPAVLHLAGERDFPELAERAHREGYVLLPFTDDFGAALSAADLVVARAGGSVWEIAAAGKPALLVPYPYAAAGHQTKNARYFEAGGGAVVVAEPELDLRCQVEELLADPARLERMAAAMRTLARPDAADVVAEELMRLAAS